MSLGPLKIAARMESSRSSVLPAQRDPWTAAGSRESRSRGVLAGTPCRREALVAWTAVDTRDDIREFLTSRRAKITPEQAGLPAYGGKRRVKGLRREEVAMLAGISVEYYTRLERGNAARRLRGRARRHRPGAAARRGRARCTSSTSSAPRNTRRPTRRRPDPGAGPARPCSASSTRSTGAPAFVRNDRLDVLAANPLGAAFYAPLFDDPARPVNSARFVFLNPRATEFFVDWDTIANDAVGILRAEAGRDPYDKRLSDLIGELSTRSEEFRVRWAAHDVKLHRTGVKRFHHPVVGDLTLDFEALDLPGDAGQTHARLHRRTRLAVRGSARPARQLGGHPHCRRGVRRPHDLMAFAWRSSPTRYYAVTKTEPPIRAQRRTSGDQGLARTD